MAREFARCLDLPLAIWVARKLSSPREPELALGAIAEGGGRYLDDHLTAFLGVDEQELQRIEKHQYQELLRRSELYRAGQPAPQLRDRSVVLVDDGLATGATVRAAIQGIRSGKPASVVLAVPVAPAAIIEELRPLFEQILVLWQPPDFTAVGACYRTFPQVTDQEVLAALHGGS